MPLGPKMAHPVGHVFNMGLYRENRSTETTRPRSLILKPKVQMNVTFYELNTKVFFINLRYFKISLI